MNVWREVGRRYVVWLLMASVTVSATFLVANPLEHMPREVVLSFFLQALLIGSLAMLSLSYFAVRLNNEKITRGMVACWLLGLYVFPDYVWNPMERVFTGVNPTISAMLVFLILTILLNIGLYFADRSAGRGGRPS